MSENEKRQRSTAKSRFTRSVNSLDKVFNLDGNNLFEASLLFEDVLKAWDNVENKHADYMSKLEANTDTEDAWIDTEQAKFTDVRRKFMKYKETVSQKHSLQAALRNRDICLKLFEEQCSRLSL